MFKIKFLAQFFNTIKRGIKLVPVSCILYPVFFVIFLYSVSSILYPSIVSAASIWDGTSCNTTEGGCTLCEGLLVTRNIIQILFEIAIPVGVGMMMWGALRLIASVGNPQNVEAGKKVMLNALIGIVIALAAWAIINTLLNMLSGSSKILPWNTINCTGGGLGITFQEECKDPQKLAQSNNVPYPARNSAAINTLINCVYSYQSVANLIDKSQDYTYQETGNTICNFTRGKQICGGCVHTTNSCHYGGANGTDGAEAVDFNAKDPSQEYALYQALETIESACNFGWINYETNHTHVRTKACDRN